jgi:hypothetical protein
LCKMLWLWLGLGKVEILFLKPLQYSFKYR